MYLPILQVESGELPPFAVVCGDPRRAEAISRKLDNARELAFAREYRTFVGEYKGTALAVVSHGVGSPGAAVCFEELIKGDVTTLIRVGTAGSYSAEHPAGSLVVSTAAIRAEGLTKQLVPDGFPAVADGEVTAALYAAAVEGAAADKSAATVDSAGTDKSAATVDDAATDKSAAAVDNAGLDNRKGTLVSLKPSTHGVTKGLTVTLDAFFTGVVEIPHKQYKQAGALAVEMEIAALYVVASLRGARAGAIVAIDGYADADLAADYNPHTNAVADAVEREMTAALEAIARLAAADRAN